MGLAEQVTSQWKRRGKARSWPVGEATEAAWESRYGHDDSQFSPEEYGDFLVTSADVFAAASLRARLMSSLDLQLYRGRGADKKLISGGPAVDLLRHVNPFWTWPRLQRMDELSRCLWGETYWAIEKDAAGIPREIWWLKPSRVKPVPHVNNYLAGFLYEGVTGEQIAFRADEIVWQRYPNPLDEFSALSPIAAARLAAETGSEMMRANRALWANGLQMGAMVVPPSGLTFGKDQADDLRRHLEDRFTGSKNAHRWAVLRFEAQIKDLGVTQRDAEFLGGMSMTLRQVANAYGIPTPLLNDLEHSTLANLKELQTALWENALKADAQLCAAEIVEQLLPMFPGRQPDYAEWDFSGVSALQESASESWGRDRQAIEVGLLTVNEVRRSRGLPDVSWGDVWYQPVNKVPVGTTIGPPSAAGEDAITDDKSTAQQEQPGDPSPPDPPPTGGIPQPDRETPVDERAWAGVLEALVPVNGHHRG